MIQQQEFNCNYLLGTGKIRHILKPKIGIDTAFKTLGKIKSVDAKVMIIENTLHISELTVSSIYKEIKNELIEEIPEWSFDLNGKILIEDI